MEEGASERLERADDAVERIEQIIDDLLTLSREGRTIDDRQFVDLTGVAEAAWKTTATADATLEVDLNPDTGVFADETRLQNVFENLFRNALSFGDGGVTIRVGREADGFYVEDDGPGIPPAEREKVFEYEYDRQRRNGPRSRDRRLHRPRSRLVGPRDRRTRRVPASSSPTSTSSTVPLRPPYRPTASDR